VEHETFVRTVFEPQAKNTFPSFTLHKEKKFPFMPKKLIGLEGPAVDLA
jgi:hypothetical protein